MSPKVRTKSILLIAGAFVGCVLLAGIAHSQQKSSGILAKQAEVPSITMLSEEDLDYGKATCPCIGIDGMKGTKEVDGAKLPADLGAHCQAWDEAEGKNQDWRKQSWCYVDPCNCKLSVPPKQQTYMPDARFRNEEIYYSYNTCGSKDLWTPEHNPKACPMQEDKESCAADKKKDGSAKCAWNDKTMHVWAQSTPESARRKHRRKGMARKSVSALALSINRAKSSLILKGSKLNTLSIWVRHAKLGMRTHQIRHAMGLSQRIGARRNGATLTRASANSMWGPLWPPTAKASGKSLAGRPTTPM